MRKMACDSWYLHETYEGTGDRCAVKEVEAFSARHIAVMISGTTIAGVLNLVGPRSIRKACRLSEWQVLY
jgi:hypothetical protein